MKKETLEEAAERLIPDNFIKVAPKQKVNAADISRHYFIEGAKWQAERMYSEEEVSKEVARVSFNLGYDKGAEWQAQRMYSEEDLKEAYMVGKHGGTTQTYYEFKEWFEQFKK